MDSRGDHSLEKQRKLRQSGTARMALSLSLVQQQPTAPPPQSSVPFVQGDAFHKAIPDFGTSSHSRHWQEEQQGCRRLSVARACQIKLGKFVRQQPSTLLGSRQCY